MLTAIIHTDANDARLAHTLGSLVSGVTDGVLKRAYVFGETGNNGITAIADETGCDLFEAGNAGLKLAAAATVTNWVLLLNSDSELEHGWANEVGRFVDQVNRANSETAKDIACFDEHSGTHLFSTIKRNVAQLFGVTQTCNGLICKRSALIDHLEKTKGNFQFPPNYRKLGSGRIKEPHHLKTRLMISSVDYD